MKYILYVYEHGQLPGLEVWGILGVKLQVMQCPGQTFIKKKTYQDSLICRVSRVFQVCFKFVWRKI